MLVKVNIKLGGVSYQFEFDEKDEMETLHKAIILSNPLRKCNVCGNEDGDLLYFTTNKDTEGNVYINVKCKCGATSKLGRYKTGGYFWHEFSKYVPKEKEEGE